ncbi:EAL domain-containing protein [Sphingosinicella sp. GR2756]|uniref:EAL domain-containing protein n=1 Tax=Sphingosinicella rhizophila TaxID=3050082 RepID=A0ABU3Q331_9SPHN|nr:EAL domain-containing protein [Sphingosinicella sp. GR2756]
MALPTLCGALLLLSGQGTSIEGLLRTMRDTIRSHPASGDVQILEIDARSLQAIAKWPWPRGIHAEIVRRLRGADARAIAFDVDFSAESSTAEDEKFASALRRAGGGVILPTFSQPAGSGKTDAIDSLPARPFREDALLAAVNILPDSDGYVRKMLLGVATGGTARPSLATMLAEQSGSIGRDYRIDYSIDPATIPRHSVIDLIQGRIPGHALAGKAVIVGATAIEMGDRYAAPGHGIVPGVVIQALAAETLIQEGLPKDYSGLWPLILAIGMILLATRRHTAAILAAASGLVLALPLIGETFFAASVPVAPALAALLAAAAFASASFFVERYRERALIDQDSGLPNLAALEVAPNDFEDRSLVVARLDRFAVIAAGLGPRLTANLVLRVADRISFTSGQRIYRIDDAALAWLHDVQGPVSIEAILESLVALMKSPVDCGRLVDVSLNFGIAADDGTEIKQLVANAALAALHAADKATPWDHYSGADSDETNWHLSLLGELSAAMTHLQVWNAYQPKLDLATGRIIGAEALVRWEHPERGPIGPDDFIPLVEAHGRARDLTAHVLGQALDDALRWQELAVAGVAVNVSATLLADHEFIEMVGQRLRASDLPAHLVTIEVTESAAMDKPEQAIAALESWRRLGVNISIDDYGTGQSSLTYLQKLPATELKIDKSFVRNIEADQRNAIMVRSTIGLAHELGMKVVAEGVEDARCLAMLGDMGCDTAQGYFISKPINAEAFAALLRESAKAAA